MYQQLLFVQFDVLDVRSAELRVLERVNIALSLAFLSPSLVVSTATMLTLIAYTSAGNDLSPEQVIDIQCSQCRNLGLGGGCRTEFNRIEEREAG